jgi:hypothetical protein
VKLRKILAKWMVTSTRNAWGCRRTRHVSGLMFALP